MKDALISSPVWDLGNPKRMSLIWSSHKKSPGTPYISQYVDQCSQLLIYSAGGSLGRLIRRVATGRPSGLRGSSSVTTLGGLCRVQKRLVIRSSRSNQDGRQCRVLLSTNPVRTRRSCCQRLSCGSASTSCCRLRSLGMFRVGVKVPSIIL